MIREWIKYGVRKGTRYRANTAGWVLADLALYVSVFSMYFLLNLTFDGFGTYNFREMHLYISTYFLVNNIFAIMFSEATSNFYDSILDGTYIYGLLTPCGLFKSLFLSNFNFPALVSTPLLISINIYCVYSLFFLSSYVNLLLYYFSVFLSVLLFTFFLLSIYSLNFWGIRSSVLGQLVSQCFSLAEKPDTVFPHFVQKLFTYVLPVFMISAVPTRIFLGLSSLFELVYCFFSPVFFFFLYKMIEFIGLKKYSGLGC